QGIGVALEVLRRHTMTPSKLGAEVDKRHRAPDQITMRHAQQLVAAGASCDQVGVYAVPDGACVDCRSEIFGPPVLVPDPGGVAAVRGYTAPLAIGPLSVDPVDPPGGAPRIPRRGRPRRPPTLRQWVDEPETRHIDGGAVIRHNPHAIGYLSCQFDAGSRTK